jgi:hypothetical protein
MQAGPVRVANPISTRANSRQVDTVRLASSYTLEDDITIIQLDSALCGDDSLKVDATIKIEF